MSFLKILLLLSSLSAFCAVLASAQTEETVEVKKEGTEEAKKEETEEEILKWEPPADFPSRFPYHLTGHDMDGGEVWIIDVGKWDIRDIADGDVKDQENFKKYVRQMYTRCGLKSRDASHESVVILDLEGYNAEKATHVKGTLLTLDVLRSFERYARDGRGYKNGILVNANFIFETFWRAGKPLLGRLGEFIDVYGTTKSKWVPKLLKSIPRDQLPEQLGGLKGHKYLESWG